MSYNMSCAAVLALSVYEVTTRSRPYARSGLDDLVNVRSLLARSSESTSPFIHWYDLARPNCSYCDRFLLYPV